MKQCLLPFCTLQPTLFYDFGWVASECLKTQIFDWVVLLSRAMAVTAVVRVYVRTSVAVNMFTIPTDGVSY